MGTANLSFITAFCAGFCKGHSPFKKHSAIEASFIDIIGEYSCKVANSIGTSNTQETKIKGSEFEIGFVNIVILMYLSITFKL